MASTSCCKLCMCQTSYLWVHYNSHFLHTQRNAYLHTRQHIHSVITRQQDYGGYIYPRAISITLQAAENLPPSFLLIFCSSPSLFSPDTYFKQMECDSLRPPTRNLVPEPQAFEVLYSQAAWGLGTSSAWTVNHDNSVRGSASGRGPTREGQRHLKPKKNDRDRNPLITGNSLRVHSLRAVNYNNRNRRSQWRRAYQKKANAIKKNDKDRSTLITDNSLRVRSFQVGTTKTEARSSLATIYACTVSKRASPGKIWTANQSN